MQKFSILMWKFSLLNWWIKQKIMFLCYAASNLITFVCYIFWIDSQNYSCASLKMEVFFDAQWLSSCATHIVTYVSKESTIESGFASELLSMSPKQRLCANPVLSAALETEEQYWIET